MKIIPLINEFTNTFNEIFKNALNPFNLESKIRNVGDEFTLKLYPEQEKYMKEHMNYIINNLEKLKIKMIKTIKFIVPWKVMLIKLLLDISLLLLMDFQNKVWKIN